MKTAISMPDEVYEQVNEYARRNKLSRSEVFVIAFRDLLDKEQRESVHARLNAALEAEPPTEDEIELVDDVIAAGRRNIHEAEW